MFDPTISAVALAIQAKTAEVLQMYGKDCRAPSPGESVESYGRSCFDAIAPYCSPERRYINPAGIPIMDAIDMVASNAIAYWERPEGEERSRFKVDGAGRQVRHTAGDPRLIFGLWSPPPRFARICEELFKGRNAPRDTRRVA
jgi:hypothetical protein